ncbi:MAG: M1 family metallopeptidase [Bacteroidota bacterium]
MRFTILALVAIAFNLLHAQSSQYGEQAFSAADSTRGSLKESRACYDVTFYDLDIELNFKQKAISGGLLTMDFRLLSRPEELQFDLFDNMELDAVRLDGREVEGLRREHQAVFFELPERIGTGESIIHTLEIEYHGQPVIAKNAPWDGGFVWARDAQERYWVGVACEGTGASLWWPNKDHLSDEPDSMQISVTVPERYFVASNGNLRDEVELDNGKKRYDWFISYPINNYNASITVGHYTHFSDTYKSPFTGDELAMDYYVLDYNEERAREHFAQSQGVLEAFEHYFGPYPYPKDGFALIETPYLGMEHQSGIAYGNRYMRGYLGGMIPRDMDWDYIIVHETGHEYFGNSISVPDHAEMWIHESFTTYMEALYVEYHYDAEAARRYLKSQRPYITNKAPILGPLGVNFEDFPGSDHYYKGAWVLHTLRHAIGDDDKWWRVLRGFYETFQHSIVSTPEVIDYFVEAIGEDWVGPFFEQYIMRAEAPKLEIGWASYAPLTTGIEANTEFTCTWTNTVKGFAMPIDILINGEKMRVIPTSEGSDYKVEAPVPKFEVAPDRFLIKY